MHSALTQKKRPSYLTLSFLLPFFGVLLVMLFSQYKPFGGYAILYSDMYHQYYPFFVEFRSTLRSGGSLLHNWSVGMGMDYLAMISYYLASPLYLLSVLVPESWLLSFFSMLLPVKLGLAGLFFGIFLKKLFQREDWFLVLFSGFYALCAWALGYLWNIMWLDTFALLPLVCLGAIQLLREKKFVLYTVTLFFSIFCNYYIGFFTCIFIALVFFCYEICCWKGFGRFFSDLLRIALFSALAIGMTAVLELPALAGLQNTHSSVNQFPTGFRLNIASTNDWKGLLVAMMQVAGNTAGGNTPTYKEGLPNLYCGVFALLLAIIFLTRKEFKVREKLCSLFLLVFFALSFIIRQLDYIWHGFHFTNMIPYRFSFLFSFVLLVMAYRALQTLEEVKIWQLILGGILFAGVCYCSKNRTNWVFWVYNGVFFLGYMALFFAMRERKHPEPLPEAEEFPEMMPLLAAPPVLEADGWEEKEENRQRRLAFALSVLMVVELGCNLLQFGLTFSGTNVKNYPSGGEATAEVIDYMKTHETELFYRADFTHTQSLNDGALNGLNGVTTFSSSANESVTKFMAALGFAAKPSYNRYCYEEASPVSNLFLNLKYQINRNEDLIHSRYYETSCAIGNITLLENNAWLPLGFVTDPALAELDFETSAGGFAFQNQLFAAATGLQKAVYSVILEYTAEGEGATVTQQGRSGHISYTATESGADATIGFEVKQAGFVCLKINAPKRNSYTIWKNGERVSGDSISLAQMAAVGDCQIGDMISVEFTCKDGEKGTLELEAAILDDAVFQQGLAILRTAPLELTRFTDTLVAGTVRAPKDGLLYTSIPYGGNWTALVDGQPAEIVTVGGAMVGLRLTAGTHTVELSYHNAAFSLGWKVSLVCLACFLGICAAVYLPRKKGRFQHN